MGADGIAVDMDIALQDDIMIAHEIEQDIEHLIRASASQVAEGFLIYPTGKRPMEEVDQTEDDISGGT